jgi:hypothetical protein
MNDRGLAAGVARRVRRLEETSVDGITVMMLWEKDGPITIQKGDETITYSLKKAHEARNWDGSNSGYPPNEPRGQRECIEKKIQCGRKYTKYYNTWI